MIFPKGFRSEPCIENVRAPGIETYRKASKETLPVYFHRRNAMRKVTLMATAVLLAGLPALAAFDEDQYKITVTVSGMS